MVAMKAAMSLSKTLLSLSDDPTAAAQEETGAMMHTGAAVESMM